MSTKKKSIEDKFIQDIECAVRCIESAMKRNKLSLLHMNAAVGILVRKETIKDILSMRAEGKTIRNIARAVHMNEKRVSAIIKQNTPERCEPCRPNNTCGFCHPVKHGKSGKCGKPQKKR